MNSRPQPSRDPVCGMAVSGSAYTATHHGTTFHFCSAQCLTRFLESPALYAGAPLSPQAVRALIKRRVLRIEHGPGLDEACRRIEAMMGVMDVRADRNRLLIEYDLRQASLAQIEAELQAAGIVIRGGLHALRRSLWRFTEHNELDNAAHGGPQACCNRPPTPR